MAHTLRRLARTASITSALLSTAVAVGALAATARAADVTASTVENGGSTTITIANAGDHAALSFSASAGDRVFVKFSSDTVSGVTTVYLKAPDGSTLTSPQSLSNGSTGYIDATTLQYAGTHIVYMSPNTNGTGSITAAVSTVPADAMYSVVPSQGGASVNPSVASPGQNMAVTFSAQVADRVFVDLLTDGLSGSGYVNAYIKDPYGTPITSTNNLLSPSGTTVIETTTLTSSGTYTLYFDPVGSSTGSLTLKVYSVPSDATTSFAPTNAGTTFSLASTVPGQNIAPTFTASAGDRVFLQVTNDALGGSGTAYFYVKRADGTPITATSTMIAPSGSSNLIDTTTLTDGGTYTVYVDPIGDKKGSVSFLIYKVPPDVSQPTMIGRSSASLATTTPGQNANVTFSAAAGQRFTYSWSNVSFAVANYSVVKPDGSILAQSGLSFGSGSLTTTAPVSGTYSAVVDPSGTRTGSLTVALTGSPGDLTGPGFSSPVAVDEGQQVDGWAGQWSDQGPFDYQWQLCSGNGSGCSDVYGATNSSLVLPSGSSGQWVRLGVTDADSSGATTVYSSSVPVLPDLQTLALAYRPDILFHRGTNWDDAEPYRPLNVDTFLNESGWVDGSFFHQICSVECSDLTTGAPALDSGSYLNIHGGDDGGDYQSSDSSCWVENDQTGIQEDCNGGDASAIYYHVSQDSNGYRYLDFWVFYRYNVSPPGTAGVDDHEGDWEGVVLALDPVHSASITNPNVKYAFYAQHGGGSWIDGSSAPFDNRHLVVYVARGSHASYPDYCASDCYQSNTVAGQSLTEGAHDGVIHWGNSEDSACAGQCVINLATTSWYDWIGRWGKDPGDALGLGQSPASPGTQGRYGCAQNSYQDTSCPQPSGEHDTAFASEGVTTKTGVPRKTTRPQTSPKVPDPRSCAGWLGGGVAVAACDPVLLRRSIRLHLMGGKWKFHVSVPGLHSGGSPGIAQVIGEPLHGGAKINLVGQPTSATILYIKTQINHHPFMSRLAAMQAMAGRNNVTLSIRMKHQRPMFFRAGRSLTAVTTQLG